MGGCQVPTWWDKTYIIKNVNVILITESFDIWKKKKNKSALSAQKSALLEATSGVKKMRRSYTVSVNDSRDVESRFIGKDYSQRKGT